jgi:hypothetical protein
LEQGHGGFSIFKKTIKKELNFLLMRGNTLTRVNDPFLNKSFCGGNGDIKITRLGELCHYTLINIKTPYP